MDVFDRLRWHVVYLLAVLAGGFLSVDPSEAAEPLKPMPGPPLMGTQPLMMEGDIASSMVDGLDRFLLREWDQSAAKRAKYWKYDFSSSEAFDKSIEPNRKRLAHMLGVREKRVPFEAMELVGDTKNSALLAKGKTYDVFAVRWPVFGDVHGEGLMLVPKEKPEGSVVAIPDADQTPEQFCGLAEGIPNDLQLARRLAENGYRVIVPTLISREVKPRFPPGRTNGSKISNREFIYRSAFELGRHIIGYEIQKVLACVDWFKSETPGKDSLIGVAGCGEGGMLALYAAALDTRIDMTMVSGYVGTNATRWQQPLDRNVFGLLEEFGDAEVVAMVGMRSLLMDARAYPIVAFQGEGGAPGKLERPSVEAFQAFQAEMERFNKIPRPQATANKGSEDLWTLSRRFYRSMSESENDHAAGGEKIEAKGEAPEKLRPAVDSDARQQRQFYELDRHNQQLLTESAYVRANYMKKLDTSSLEKYKTSVEEYRTYFKDEVIGSFDIPLLPTNARTRQIYETEKWIGYEVVLDVWQDVIAYGVLLVPKDLKPGEKRPMVVCQHGLEGRPADVISGDSPYYHDFAAKLCERGFITFAPQNAYIFKDRFRTLQRKANPLKKSLFSIIVPQHQQIVNWLKTLPGVDGERIAFYGLSYGGKSAMRIPPLVPDYCLSICSADFNEWVAKNASTRLPFSYVWTGEYEIFEFDLGSTFNYAEMTALICPRPFMVERGHTDGVSTDEWVAFEFAKVRNLYSYKLKIPDLCEMEVFDGPHTINGKGTYDFLHKHLKWPKRE